MHHHQEKKWANQQAAAQPQYEEQAPAPEPQVVYAEAPAAAAPDLTAQLQQLAQLHDSGVLSDEEFSAAKAKLIGG